MFDRAHCAQMRDAKEPVVSWESLLELERLLSDSLLPSIKAEGEDHAKNKAERRTTQANVEQQPNAVAQITSSSTGRDDTVVISDVAEGASDTMHIKARRS